ncbi:peptide chain release factor N(5)-glutamine methyltransferase, partial [Microbacterium arborescens]
MSTAPPPASTLTEVLRAATAELEAAFVPTPQVDAELLAAHVLGIGRGELSAAVFRGDSIGAEEAARLADLVAGGGGGGGREKLTDVETFL